MLLLCCGNIRDYFFKKERCLLMTITTKTLEIIDSIIADYEYLSEDERQRVTALVANFVLTTSYQSSDAREQRPHHQVV